MIAGFTDFFRGLAAVARRPRLWVWTALPAAISLAILVAVAWVGLAALDTPAERLVAPLPDAIESLVAGFLDVLLIAAVLLAGYFLFFSIAAMLAAPFNEMLSESLELELTGQKAPGFSLATFARDVVVGIAHAARRLGGYLILVTALFVIGLVIPVVGPLIAAAGTAWLTARSAAWEAMDAVFARKGASYRDKQAVIRRHRGRWFGLGAAMALLLLVPGLNLVVLSSGAAGATLLCHDRGELDA